MARKSQSHAVPFGRFPAIAWFSTWIARSYLPARYKTAPSVFIQVQFFGSLFTAFSARLTTAGMSGAFAPSAQYQAVLLASATSSVLLKRSISDKQVFLNPAVS